MNEKHPSLPNLLTREDIKKYLKIGNKKVDELLRRKTFPSYKIGSRYYILEDKFIEWQELQTKKLFTKS